MKVFGFTSTAVHVTLNCLLKLFTVPLVGFITRDEKNQQDRGMQGKAYDDRIHAQLHEEQPYLETKITLEPETPKEGEKPQKK